MKLSNPLARSTGQTLCIFSVFIYDSYFIELFIHKDQESIFNYKDEPS